MLTPGPALDISSMISIKEPQARAKTGLFLTTVYSDMDTTVAKWLQAQVSGNAVVMPRGEFIPPAMSNAEYNRMVVQMMDESKTVAKIVALRSLGYDVKATGEGARVEKLLPGSMATGILDEGDVVVGAEGQKIEAATDLVNLVRRQKPGTQLTLDVERNGDPFRARVGTRESDTEPGIAVIGVLINTHLFGHDLPVAIDIDTQDIGGPSAGMLFSLGIVDSLLPEGLAAGRKIAGTGTISLDGSVGPVGGVAQKVIGAEQAGAGYFLAPRENYEVAQRAARRIQVIRAGTLDEAINSLRNLKPAALKSLKPAA